MKIKLFLIFISIIIGIAIGFFIQKSATSKIQNKYDSLNSESFIKDLNIMRYEEIIEKVSEDTTCRIILDKAINETE
jgi:uncharacterized protein YneF (UPF0154 family)